MIKSNYKLLLVLFIGILCTSLLFSFTKKSSEKQIDDPSELALLMREMDAHFNKLKIQIEKDKKLKERYFPRLKVATPTKDDSLIHTPVFNSYSEVFENQLNNLYTSEISDRKQNYNAAVQTCVACHQTFCQGPIPRIKKLLIND